jgi:hypothetical protein
MALPPLQLELALSAQLSVFTLPAQLSVFTLLALLDGAVPPSIFPSKAVLRPPCPFEVLNSVYLAVGFSRAVVQVVGDTLVFLHVTQKFSILLLPLDLLEVH